MVTIKVKGAILSLVKCERLTLQIKKVVTSNVNNIMCTISCKQPAVIKSSLSRSLVFGESYDKGCITNEIQVRQNTETSFWLTNNEYEIEISQFEHITNFAFSSEVPAASPLAYSNTLELFAKAKSMQELDLSGAAITGDIISLGALTNLSALNLAKSLVSGRLEDLLIKLLENGKRGRTVIDISSTNISFNGFANISGELFISFSDNGIEVFADKQGKFPKAKYNKQEWEYYGNIVECHSESSNAELTIEDITLPQSMDTRKARTVFLNAINKNYMIKTPDGYKWTQTKVQLAYLCSMIYGCKYTSKGNEGNQMPTKDIEKLFNISRLADTTRQMFDAKNNQSWRTIIDELIPD